MISLIRLLRLWIRGKNPQREWYRRQEQSIRDSITRRSAQDVQSPMSRQSRLASETKALGAWEEEGGSLARAAAENLGLESSTLADNAGWRADRRTTRGSK